MPQDPDVPLTTELLARIWLSKQAHHHCSNKAAASFYNFVYDEHARIHECYVRERRTAVKYQAARDRLLIEYIPEVNMSTTHLCRRTNKPVRTDGPTFQKKYFSKKTEYRLLNQTATVKVRVN